MIYLLFVIGLSLAQNIPYSNNFTIQYLMQWPETFLNISGAYVFDASRDFLVCTDLNVTSISTPSGMIYQFNISYINALSNSYQEHYLLYSCGNANCTYLSALAAVHSSLLEAFCLYFYSNFPPSQNLLKLKIVIPLSILLLHVGIIIAEVASLYLPQNKFPSRWVPLLAILHPFSAKLKASLAKLELIN
jgi:hypothetical protein